MPLKWSRREWEREEAEQQRRLLDLAAAQRRVAAATQPRRGAPVVKLEESSDDDLYRPTPPRFGEAGVEPPGAATAGRRRLLRQRRGLHDVLPPIRHVDRHVFSYSIGRIRIYYEFGLSM
jgi:hypothetical protein